MSNEPTDFDTFDRMYRAFSVAKSMMPVEYTNMFASKPGVKMLVLIGSQWEIGCWSDQYDSWVDSAGRLLLGTPSHVACLPPVPVCQTSGRAAYNSGDKHMGEYGEDDEPYTCFEPDDGQQEPV